MKPIRQVLVIVDKPQHEQVALHRALALQKATGAHLHLVAFAYHSMVDQKETFGTHERGTVKKEIVRERTQWLRDLVVDEGVAASDLTIETVWTKDIAGWVVDRHASSPVDLVIKSAHRSQTLLHTPTDWSLLRDCPAPVLLCVERNWPARLRVLATLDLHRDDRAHTALNHKVLDASAYFASLFRGSLWGVYAIEVPRIAGDLDLIDTRAAIKAAKASAEARLPSLIRGYDLPRTRVHLPVGKVGAVVNGVAARVKADLLVMGTTARKGVAAFVLGNSAERVLSKTRCDVLALKP